MGTSWPAPLRRTPAGLLLRRPSAPAALAAVAVVLQIGYPLVHGTTRDHLAVAIVAAFALSCLLHAATTRSLATAGAVLVLTGGLGFAVELLGVHTGVPFGHYRYGDVLGPRLLGVPPIVALAWTMLAWPAAVVARHLVHGRWARIVVGAWALAAADLFLDPQLVALGAWRWADPSPHLPGVATVPLTNYAGWLVVALVISAAVQQVAGDGRDGCAVALYLWLWAGWTVAQLVFLDLRASALWGTVGMGVVAVPLLRRELAGLRPAPAPARPPVTAAASAPAGPTRSHRRRSTPPR